MSGELDVGRSALLTDIAMCINYYRLFSPGLYCCIHAAVRFDDGTEFCPGVVMQVNHGPLKQSEADNGFKGTPNFVLDVFGDDLPEYEQRRDRFERQGVFEYVAVMDEGYTWNRLVEGKFKAIETADDHLIMSAALPGLWIPPLALTHRNWWAIIATIERGVSRRGHHEFMDTIWNGARYQTPEEISKVVDDYKSGRMGESA